MLELSVEVLLISDLGVIVVTVFAHMKVLISCVFLCMQQGPKHHELLGWRPQWRT